MLYFSYARRLHVCGRFFFWSFDRHTSYRCQNPRQQQLHNADKYKRTYQRYKGTKLREVYFLYPFGGGSANREIPMCRSLTVPGKKKGVKVMKRILKRMTTAILTAVVCASFLCTSLPAGAETTDAGGQGTSGGESAEATETDGADIAALEGTEMADTTGWYGEYVTDEDTYRAFLETSRALAAEYEEQASAGRRLRRAPAASKVTIDEAMGASGIREWLQSHESDGYYLGTTYCPDLLSSAWANCGHPNGGGEEPHGMNCTGFVADVFRSCGGDLSRIPDCYPAGRFGLNTYYCASNWQAFAQRNNVLCYRFNSIEEALASGVMHKGDVLYFQPDWNLDDQDDHIGFFWGNSPSENVFWHSCHTDDSLPLYTADSVHYGNQISPLTTKTSLQYLYVYPIRQSGSVRVVKKSTDSEITDGNSCYTLAGAKYGVYRDRECTDKAEETITGEDGSGISGSTLVAGQTYYVKEIAAPYGYRIDPGVYPVVAATDEERGSDGNKGTVVSKEEPLTDELQLTIRKEDEEGKVLEGEDFTGTQFTVSWYRGYFTEEDLPDPERTWTLEVRKNPDGTFTTALGVDTEGKDYKVTGDSYFIRNSKPVLPLGTIRIEETKAAEGFLTDAVYLNGELQNRGTVIAQIRADGGKVSMAVTDKKVEEDDFTAMDSPIRGGAKFAKIDADSKLDQGSGDAVLAGARIGIYSCTDRTLYTRDRRPVRKNELYMSILTDENGTAVTGETDLAYGDYYACEEEPSTGYRLNRTWRVYFSIRENGRIIDCTEKPLKEEPIHGGFKLEKVDRELAQSEPLGSASLKGIRYEIRNVSEHSIYLHTDEGIQEIGCKKENNLVTIIETNEKGEAGVEKDFLPYGTYLIREIPEKDGDVSANSSYLVNKADPGRTIQIRKDGSVIEEDCKGERIVFADQVKRNDLIFRKVDDRDEPLAGIPFVAENTVTHEKHILVTDENGIFNSAAAFHSKDTNANDFLLKDGKETDAIDSSTLKTGCGIWFGMGRDGTVAEPDDTVPAFPYGSYTLTELRCTANKGYKLIEDYPFSITKDVCEMRGRNVDLNCLHDEPVPPQISTRAFDRNTKSRIADATPDENGMIHVAVSDTVHCENLRIGGKYILSASLWNAETEDRIKMRLIDEKKATLLKYAVTGEVAFTADADTMDIEVPLKEFVTEKGGLSVVVYESLYEMEEDGSRGKKAAEHNDPDNEDQTVRVPEIPEKVIKETAGKTKAAPVRTGDPNSAAAYPAAVCAASLALALLFIGRKFFTHRNSDRR